MWNRREREGTHLSFWPIVLLKNVIVHFSRPVSHEHYSLAAHTAMSSLIKLQKERKHIKIYIKSKSIDLLNLNHIVVVI